MSSASNASPPCWAHQLIVRLAALLILLGTTATNSLAQPMSSAANHRVISLSQPSTIVPGRFAGHDQFSVQTASHAIPVTAAQDLKLQVPPPTVGQAEGIALEEPDWSSASSPSDQMAAGSATPTNASPTSISAAPAIPGLNAAASLPSVNGFEMGCKAAQHWLPSKLLRTRANSLVQLYCEEDECTRHAANVLANFLRIQAIHQEGIGAASGLRAYYTRISLADQLVLTNTSLNSVNLEEKKQHSLMRQGFAAGTDMSSFDRLRIEIKDSQLEIFSQDRKLQSLLAEIARVNYGMNGIQQEPLTVINCDLDCNNLKQIALSIRQDLYAWVYLSCHVNEETAPIFAKMIPTLIGGYVFPMPTICGLKQLLCPPDYSCLAANMQREIQLTIETHRRWISQAVQEKCCDLQLAYERVELAEQTLASWEKREQQLIRLRELGEVRPTEAATARTEILKSKAAVLARKLDAKIAEVTLAEATGGIARRCCAGEPWLLTGN